MVAKDKLKFVQSSEFGNKEAKKFGECRRMLTLKEGREKEKKVEKALGIDPATAAPSQPAMPKC